MRRLRWSFTFGVLFLCLIIAGQARGSSQPAEFSVGPGGHPGNLPVILQIDKLSERQEEAAVRLAPVEQQIRSTNIITQTYSINPGAFLYDLDSTDIVMSIYYGLGWVPNTTERAGFYMGRPPDWDRQTPVVVHITFALGNSDVGTVNWRLRLNTYTPNSGEWLTNPASRDADEILVFASGPSSLRIYSQTFTIPAADFNGEPYWSFFFTRGDGTNGETFAGNLYVMGVDVEYQALLPARNTFLPIMTR